MSDDTNETTTKSNKMTLPSVKELAKRFETSTRVETKPVKRIGKNRISEAHKPHTAKIYRANNLIVPRKSSLKRRTKSHGELISTNNQSSQVRKSHSLDCAINRAQVAAPKPAPRLKPLMETAKPPPVYEERCRVSLTINTQDPPPLPSCPPSRDRIKRIPSVVKPVPAPRSSQIMSGSMTLSRASLKSPPPPPPTLEDPKKRIPRIPLPETPKIFTEDGSDDIYESCYEQINNNNLILVEAQPSSSSDYSYCSANYSRGSSEAGQIYHSGNTVSQSTPNVNDNIYAESNPDEEIFDEAEEEEEAYLSKRDSIFRSSTLHRNYKSGKRSSAVEFDKLLRFKSELQLNITKKVGQLRQKVGDKNPKRSSKCNLSADMLDTDYSTQMSSSCHKSLHQDRDIYGDDWSSEDDEKYHDDRRSSMYRQLEEQLNKAFPEYSSRRESRMSSEYENLDLVDEAHQIEGEMTACVARPAISHLPIEDNWEPTVNPPDDASPDEEAYKRQYTCRMVPNEQPLYQHYMLEAREEIEEIPAPTDTKPSRRESSISSDSGRGADCSTTSASALTSNTSMRRDRLVGASNFGSQRSLWCELAEVKEAGLLEKMDDESKLRQEAYFEVITSEASYLLSLNVLITHFMASPQMLGSKSAYSVLTDSDRKHLFSNIFAVRDCSERLLCDLESRLEQNLVLDDICDILSNHFNSYFEVYVKYCSNQVYQDRTLRRLKTDNSGFLTAVQKLEEDRQCQGLDMRSFLMLPMQRITRYPLLLYAILDKLDSNDVRFKTATEALTSANRIVRECNEGARRMERTEQLLEIDRRLVYKDADLKRIPLVSNNRYLVKRGVLTQIVERKNTNILQSRQKARSLHVFLFSDVIMITKKKLNGTYVCKDYASRKFIDMQPIEPDNPKIPPGAVSSLVGRPHLFLCTLMRNAREKQTELLLSADSETDRERWLSAVRPPTSTNPEEKVYAEWDCPQALVVHEYRASQSDELSLNIGEVVNILRKMPDGWLFGERISDGLGGWFPSSYVQNIVNDHTRAKNYRQRLRLIQAAAGWHGHFSSATIGRGGLPLIDRLRRMSNPKNYFQSGTIGL